MFFERIVYVAVILIFLSYYIYRYVRFTNKYALVNIALQVIALTLLALVYSNNQMINAYLQAMVFTFGYVIPLITLISIRYKINYINEFKYIMANVINKKEKAKNIYEALVLDYPKYKVYKKLGMIYLENNELNKSLDSLSKAVEINSNNEVDLYKISYVQVCLNNYEEAKTILNNITINKPKYKPALNLLAYIYSTHNNDNNKALKVYFDIIKYNSKDANTYYNIGATYIKEKQLKNAKKFLESAIKYNDRQYNAHYLLGYIYLLSNEYELAQKHLQTSTQDKQIYSKAYYMLARLYMKQNEKGKATNCLNLAIENNEILAKKMQQEEIFEPISQLAKSVDDIEKINNSNVNNNLVKNKNEYITKFEQINVDDYIVFEQQMNSKNNKNKKKK